MIESNHVQKYEWIKTQQNHWSETWKKGEEGIHDMLLYYPIPKEIPGS